MKLGLLDVDGHGGFPNLALMKIARYFKNCKREIEWAMPLFEKYDTIFASKIFTFSPEPNWNEYNFRGLEKGGTGYDIKKVLHPLIDEVRNPDYSIYPNCNYSIQFYSRGCIRKCGFCLVNEKEGHIRAVEPMDLNPKGEWIEVLDNNFFANPDWEWAVKDLKSKDIPVKFHGVDVRIMTEEHAYWLNQLKLRNQIHIAWDLPQLDLRPNIREMLKYISPDKIVCYVLVGFNSTREQDYERLRTLKDFGIAPFVQPYRDFQNKRKPSRYELDIARWANKRQLFRSMDFMDYSQRVGEYGRDYFDPDYAEKMCPRKPLEQSQEPDLFSDTLSEKCNLKIFVVDVFVPEFLNPSQILAFGNRANALPFQILHLPTHQILRQEILDFRECVEP